MSSEKVGTTDFSIKDVEILDNTTCYSGFMQLNRITLKHRLFQGGWSAELMREVVHRDPGVGVLLYDPDLDKVLMVEQFRVGCLEDAGSPWKLELVAGLIDKDESAREVAIRETEEEAGVRIDRVIPVCEYYHSPGSSSEKLSIFCAGFDARREEGVFGLDAEHEDIRTVLLSRQAAEQAIRDGVIDNAMSIIALQWLGLNLAQVRQTLAGER